MACCINKKEKAVKAALTDSNVFLLPTSPFHVWDCGNYQKWHRQVLLADEAQSSFLWEILAVKHSEGIVPQFSLQYYLCLHMLSWCPNSYFWKKKWFSFCCPNFRPSFWSEEGVRRKVWLHEPKEHLISRRSSSQEIWNFIRSTIYHSLMY